MLVARMLGYRTMQEFDQTMTYAEFIDWIAIMNIEAEARNESDLDRAAREAQGL